MTISYKHIKTRQEFIDAIRLRVEVFIKEQCCKPGWEPDEEDKISKHFIAKTGGKVVGTARLRQTKGKELKIERMVIDKKYRGKGIGKDFLVYIVEQAKKSKAKRIWMQAQVQAQIFYEKCGFRLISSRPYDLYGIQHVDMELVLL